MQPILQVNGLNKVFKVKSSKLFEPPKPLQALSGIDFEVRQGETIGIIGESGCGKSTLGKIIMGIESATSGSIRFNDENILGVGKERKKQLRKDIQIIFQDPYSSLDPRKTIEYLIEEPMVIHHVGTPQSRKAKVIELLELVGLSRYQASRYPHEFSGGQRQRINIARALTLDPKLIVCDEPVSALDVSIQSQVLNLFNELQKKLGLTYIFISHDLNVVKYISDRIAIMYLGSIVEMGTAAEIYNDPKHPYTNALFHAIPPESPLVQEDVRLLKGEVPSPFHKPKGCPFSTRCPKYQPRCQEGNIPFKEMSQTHKVACTIYQ
ncbi:MAG: ABC transporter ATP-binding protein [Lachnospiraceae bacterium]